MKTITTLLSVCLLLVLASRGSAQTSGSPAPVLVYFGPEFYSTGGRDFTRYRYQVENFGAYPNDLFAPAPSLPPCGTNTNASRTWVDFFDLRGKRLYGFCALGSPQDLNTIWFALEQGEVPPSWVYVELTDRQTNTKYKSSLVETVQ